MRKFIKNIGGVRFNGFGADLYENKNGSHSICFDKYCNNLPMDTCVKFNSLAEAENFIESKEGSNGLNTLVNILESQDIV